MKCIALVLLIGIASAAAKGSRFPPLSPFDAKVRKTFEKADKKGTLDESYKLLRKEIPIKNPSRSTFNKTAGTYNKGNGARMTSLVFTQVVAALRKRSTLQLSMRAGSALLFSMFMVRILPYHLWMNLDIIFGNLADLVPIYDFTVIDSEMTLQFILTVTVLYNIAHLLYGGIKTIMWLGDDKVKVVRTNNKSKLVAGTASNSATVDPSVYYVTPPPPPPVGTATIGSFSSATSTINKDTSSPSITSNQQMVLGVSAAAAATTLLSSMDSSSSGGNSRSYATKKKKLSALNKKKNKKAPAPPKRKPPPPSPKKRPPPPPPKKKASVPPPKKKKKVAPPPPKKKKPTPPQKKKAPKKKVAKKKVVAAKPVKKNNVENGSLTTGAKARGAVAAGIALTVGAL